MVVWLTLLGCSCFRPRRDQELDGVRCDFIGSAAVVVSPLHWSLCSLWGSHLHFPWVGIQSPEKASPSLGILPHVFSFNDFYAAMLKPSNRSRNSPCSRAGLPSTWCTITTRARGLLRGSATYRCQWSCKCAACSPCRGPCPDGGGGSECVVLRG